MPVGLLQITRRDVVGAGVTQHDLVNTIFRYIAAESPDHHRQLGLVIDPLGLPRQSDGLPRTDHRGAGLEEDHRLCRHLVAHFLGVLRIVASDGDDFGRQHRRDQPHVSQRHDATQRFQPAKGVAVHQNDRIPLDHCEEQIIIE